MSPLDTPCQPTESTLSRNSSGVAEPPDGSTWLSVVARHAGELQSIQHQLQRTDVARDLHVLRVNQMDALRLDDEMRLMLKEQLMRVFTLVPCILLSPHIPSMHPLPPPSPQRASPSPLTPRVSPVPSLPPAPPFWPALLPLPAALIPTPSPWPAAYPHPGPSAHAWQAAWVARCEAEVELLLDVLVWRFSVWADRPLPGCALMNLRFRDERTARAGAGAAAPPAVPVRTGVEGPGLTVGQKVLWLVLTGGVKYVWARLHSTRWLLPVHAHMPPNAYGRHGSGSEALQRQQASWRHWLWRFLHRAEGAVKLASLLNLIVFLHSAKFRTLPERLLGIRAVYAKPHMARAVSFEYMNRQLVWNEFSELLLLVLPLISVSAIKQTFSSLFRLPSSSSPTAGDGCPVCSAQPILMPYRAQPCAHVRLPVLLQRAHSPPCGNCSAPRGCARAAWRGDGQADRRKSVACHAAESGDVVPADWVDTAGTHKRPRQVFYAKKVRRGPFNGDNAGGEWDAEGGGGGMVRVSSEARSKSSHSFPALALLPRMHHATSQSSPTHPPLPPSLPNQPHIYPLKKQILIAFDDVSVPLPPMRRPDVRQLIMEEAERDCVAAGITDIRFTVDIGVTRHGEAVQVRGEGGRGGMGGMGLGGMGGMGLGGMGWGKWESMGNYNAVDIDETVDIGVTRHGEAVQINRHYAEADLVVYANVNYVSMDGGYKSYATGLVHYNSLQHNHDSKTLRNTRHALLPFYASFAPGGQLFPLYAGFVSELVRNMNIIESTEESFQSHRASSTPLLQLFPFYADFVPELLFPFYADFVPELVRNMNPLQKLLMHSTLILFKLLPLWLCVKVLWFMRGPFGLLQVTAGETQAVHERTLAAIYRDKVMDIDGQADILILAPSALGPYTKDMYLNPLLVRIACDATSHKLNAGCLTEIPPFLLFVLPSLSISSPPFPPPFPQIVVNNMHYKWSSPAHNAYRRLFEEVLAVAPGLDEFERFQQQFVEDQQLNDIYRRGQGPAAVHGFYMYTWAAHGMDKVGKVYVVGAKDPRGPAVLRWEMADTIQDAVDQARVFLGNSKAAVTYLRCPPVGYVRVHTEGQGEGSAVEQAQGEVAQAVSKHQ
ncbi:unnamed protein product [Closterium sp. NIES-64]|nr:unnamed protein product [Closterium sp. NIES-64]